jgi:hypothetical protein
LGMLLPYPLQQILLHKIGYNENYIKKTVQV